MESEKPRGHQASRKDRCCLFLWTALTSFSHSSHLVWFSFGYWSWGPWLWSAGGRAKLMPQSDPPISPTLLHFPFPVIQASQAIATSHCQVNINQEATAPGSLRNGDFAEPFQGGAWGKRHKGKFHVVPLITGWKERGESSNRAPQARPGSQLWAPLFKQLLLASLRFVLAQTCPGKKEKLMLLEFAPLTIHSATQLWWTIF